MTYYVIRFKIAGRDTGVTDATLYAGFTQKGRKGRWGFASEGLHARHFRNPGLALKVVKNAPPYKELVAGGGTWEIVKITEEVVEV